MKKVKNNNRREYKKKIPEEIKVLFGKFYVYSFVISLFFFIVYPFWLVKCLSKWSLIGILVVSFIFYLSILYDVKKKKKHFSSSIFMVLIFIVFSSFLFSLAKLVG